MADDFLTTYAPLANDIATRTGLDPATILGVIDTETGHGQHVSGNNIFGISPSGPQGQYVAGYPDVQTASNAFINLMQTPRYAGVAAAPDPGSQAVALVKSGYNTANPAYAAIVSRNAQSAVKQLGYQDSSSGGPQPGVSINATTSQPAPDYSDQPAAAPASAAPTPDYNTPPPSQPPASAQPPQAGSAKDRVLADPALGGSDASAATQPPAQGATAKDRVLADPALQVTEKPPATPAPTPAVDEYGRVITPLAAAPAAPTSLEDLRSKIQQADINVLKNIAPGPDAGPVESFARKAAMLGAHTAAAVAQIPINILMGIEQGPSGGITWNPETQSYGATPELQGAASLGAGGLRFSGAHPLEFVPPSGTFDRGPPIPPAAAENLLTPAAKARAAEISYPSTDIPTVTVRPSPAGGATAATGLADLGGAAQAIGANLRDMLWDKLQRGDTTELGRPSQILTDAKAAMDSGAIKSRSDFDAWTQQWGAQQRAARQGTTPQPTHIYQSADHDYPVTPTGVEQTHTDGRVYAEVKPPNGPVTWVPKDQLVANKTAQPEPQPAATPATVVASSTGIPPPPRPETGPQPAGAQITPGYEAIHTPAEEAAYRANAEGQKLLEPQKIGEPDLNQYIPGETVNNAEREQTVKAARELKELGIRVPEASQLDKEAAESNNTARTIYLDNTTKGQVEIANRNTQRQADIEADKATVFAPENIKGPVDLQPVIDHMQEVLNRPFNRQNTALKEAYKPWLERLKAVPDGVIQDPEEAWGLRYDMDQQTDKFAQRDNPNMHRVAHNLNDAAGALDKQIEAVAPGYADMLARYKEHSRAIDEMTVLQGAKDKFRGPGQKLTYNDFQRYMKNVVDSRMTPSTDLNAYKAISDENMQRLWNLRDSLRRTASAKELAMASGSDTMPNIIDALKGIGKMGGTAALHAYVGAHLGPGGNFALQSLGALGKSLNDRRTIRRATTQMNQLLRPPGPLRVPPGQENPLQPGAP